MSESSSTAVVLGASVAGLLAARVLSEFYSEVTVVERDTLSDQPVTRRGVPQGVLPHIPAARGIRIMNELFPGFIDELVSAGSKVWDDGDLSRMCVMFHGHQFQRVDTIPDPELLAMYFVHRPFLEWRLRRRVAALGNVEILDSHDAVRLTSTAQCNRVTGVVVAHRDSGAEATLSSDLVVDATGRGSRTPVFLEQLGFSRPPEDELTVQVTYAGLPVRLPRGELREFIAFAAPQPSRPRGYAMFAGQDDTYMLAVQTVAGHRAPSDHASLLNCLSEMAPPHVLAAARCATPLADVTQYRFRSNRWRRYDKLAAMPDGLVVIGDALCNFNPLYGQGMSVAGIEALVLRDCLTRAGAGLGQRFFRDSAKQIGVAWRAAVNSDLALPQIAGKRPASVRLANAYLNRVFAAAEAEPALIQQFLLSLNMIEPPSRLLRPSMVARVVKASRRRTAGCHV